MAKVNLLLLFVVCVYQVNAHYGWGGGYGKWDDYGDRGVYGYHGKWDDHGGWGDHDGWGDRGGWGGHSKWDDRDDWYDRPAPEKPAPPKHVVEPAQKVEVPTVQPKIPVAPVQQNIPAKPKNLCDDSCSLKIQTALGHLPDNFMSSQTLNCLDVSNNVVNSVSKMVFGALPNLKYANFKGSSFDHNPLLEAGHALLEVLDLSFNKPPSSNYHVKVAGSFPKLRRMHCGGSPMKSFRCGGNLPQLSHLDLSNTWLEMDDFKTLPRSLEFLNLHNNKLPSLTLGNLDKLTNLFVSAVGKTINSIHLENLPKLESLSLPSCGISDPSKLILKGIDNLVHADLSDNLFPSIDLGMFDSSPNLKKLNLAKNPNLTHIRPSPRVKFDEIDVSGSPVKNFDWFPPTLTKINLRENNLEDISSICVPSESSPDTPKCPNLVEIDLSVNKIPAIDDRTFVHVKTLRILDLSINRIENIHPNTFNGLTSLTMINLSGNSIKLFPQVKDPGPIELLRLNNNKLEIIPNYNFYYLTSLKRLFLNNNSIITIGPDAFAGLDNLEELDLSHNKLTKLPSEWTLPLQSLQDLDLRGNRFINNDAMEVNWKRPRTNVYTSHPTSFKELVKQNVPLNETPNLNNTFTFFSKISKLIKKP